MNIFYIVHDFPVLSQTFIQRLIEEIIDYEKIKLTVIVTKLYDEEALQKTSKKIFGAIQDKKINIVFDKPYSENRVISECLVYSRAIFLNVSEAIRLLFLRTENKPSIKKRLLALKLYNLLSKAGTADIIHAQFMNLMPQLLSLAGAGLMSGNPELFSSVRGADISVKNLLSDQDINSANKSAMQFICVSESLKNICIERGIAAASTHVVYSGLDIENIEYLSPSSRNNAAVTFIQIGRLIEKKGFDLSIRAVSDLIAKGIDCRLLIVGDGPLHRHLMDLANSSGILSYLDFMGSMSNTDVIRQLYASNILLVPSKTGKDGDQEGIPNVAKEAMAAGCIVIASNHSGLPELVQDGQTGYVFEEGDSLHLSQCMQRAIRQKDDWDDIADRASQSVRSAFDSGVTTKKLIKIYEK